MFTKRCLTHVVSLILVLSACTLQKEVETPVPIALISVNFYLISSAESGQPGQQLGCGDTAAIASTIISGDSDLATTVQGALNGLFAARNADYASLGYVNYFDGMGLAANTLTINGDLATIELSGDLILTGVCSDAAMQGQLLLTIFQYPELNNALIRLNGQNLKQFFDMSGTATEDALYTRGELGT